MMWIFDVRHLKFRGLDDLYFVFSGFRIQADFEGLCSCDLSVLRVQQVAGWFWRFKVSRFKGLRLSGFRFWGLRFQGLEVHFLGRSSFEVWGSGFGVLLWRVWGFGVSDFNNQFCVLSFLCQEGLRFTDLQVHGFIVYEVYFFGSSGFRSCLKQTFFCGFWGLGL